MDANITFKDSLCFLPMHLAELPDTFNLVELHKGFFPHAFHTRENLSYRGSIPATQYFQPQATKQKKREEFDTWYAAELERNEEYVLWDELNKYCHSDMIILEAACLEFIQEFQEEAGFNPVEKCVTIASACNLFWRRELVPEDTIAIEPLNGWHRNQVNQSKVALEWLCYEDFKLGENRLHHFRNRGEQKVLFLDGYHAETKTVYKFHGCLFHGRPTCFPIHRQRKHYCHPDRTINEVYEANCRKTRQLQQAGYKVIEKWECAFNKDKKSLEFP